MKKIVHLLIFTVSFFMVIKSIVGFTLFFALTFLSISVILMVIQKSVWLMLATWHSLLLVLASWLQPLWGPPATLFVLMTLLLCDIPLALLYRRNVKESSKEGIFMWFRSLFSTKQQTPINAVNFVLGERVEIENCEVQKRA